MIHSNIGPRKCSICAKPLFGKAEYTVCTRPGRCVKEYGKQYKAANSISVPWGKCELCGGRIRHDNRLGVCFRNKTCVAEWRKRYCAANSEKIAAQQRRHQKAHRQEIHARNRRWAAANREKVNESSRKCGAARRQKIRLLIEAAQQVSEACVETSGDGEWVFLVNTEAMTLLRERLADVTTS